MSVSPDVVNTSITLAIATVAAGFAPGEAVP